MVRRNVGTMMLRKGVVRVRGCDRVTLPHGCVDRWQKDVKEDRISAHPNV